MVKAYAFGLFSAAVGVLVLAVLWFGLQPKQEPGLLWGDAVYETREEFDGYLKSKGLSYKTWLARNPGVAPWEPESFRLGAITVEASPKKVQLLLATLAWVLATFGALLLLRDRDPGTRFARPAAVLFSSVLAVVLVAGFWQATQPGEKQGLLWGGTVYTSKEQFKLYLRAKGLSYKTWLARNPGAAPWEPAPAAAAKARETTRSPSPTKPRRTTEARRTTGAPAEGDDGWAMPSLPLPALGLALATGCAVLLLRARRRVAARLATPFGAFRVRRVNHGDWGSTASATAVAASRRLGGATLRAASRMKASAPVYGSRVRGASRAVAKPLLQLARTHALTTGDMAFALLTVVGVLAFATFVVLVLTL